MESATVMVQSLDQALVDYVRTQVKALVNTPGMKPKGHWKGSPFYVFGDNISGHVALYDEVDEEVIYFVQYQKVKHLEVEAGRQVLVWRLNNHIATTGFALEVFFGLLLPKFHVLFADVEQTERGRSFWLYALEHALTKRDGRYCYAYDGRNTEAERFIPLPTLKSIDAHRTLLWGSHPDHAYTFPVISDHPLI